MIVLPGETSAEFLTDWLEASLLTQRANRISDAAILDLFEEADFADAEASLASIVQTQSLRRRVVGVGYPIERDGQGFARNATWRQSLPYSFMLFASLNQAYRELNYAGAGTANRPAELFEFLTSAALERYLDCKVIRFGASRRAPMPAAFPAALRYSVGLLQEAIGLQDVEEHNSGDDGLDLIGWRTFDDGRASQAVILAQCAIGTDWSFKRGDLSLSLWRRHIDWHSAPLKGFAVPFHHQAGRAWRETATRAGIIFDRLRIAKLVTVKILQAPLRGAMTAWCEERVAAISALET